MERELVHVHTTAGAVIKIITTQEIQEDEFDQLSTPKRSNLNDQN